MSRDPDWMLQRLREHLLQGPRISGLRAISTGHSNETYHLEGLDLILRLPPSDPPLLERVLDLRQQFDLLAVLGGCPAALPVPAVRFMGDASILGAPFFLMQRVEGLPWGDWAAPSWALEASDSVREGVSRQAVEALVHLHRWPPLDVLGKVRSLHDELQRWQDTCAGCRQPLLEQAFQLLHDTAPAEAPAAPCHGDPKLANMLWKEGRLMAWLDWELAFNGDPRWDLAYHMSPLTSAHRQGAPGHDRPGFWPRARVMRYWEAATGRSSERLLWFDAAVRAKIAAILAFGHRLSLRGASADPRLAGWEEPARANAESALRLARLDAAAR